MALHWSWSVGNETLTDLQAMGWTPNTAFGVLALTSDADKVYSYAGSPTRYGWICDGNTGYMNLPQEAVAGLNKGWVAVPWKSAVATGHYTGQNVIRVEGTSSEKIDVRMTSAGALSLYVSNTFKETTAAIDWLSWRYIALRFDMSVSPWSGQVFVDGVAASSLATQADAAEPVGTIRVGPGPARLTTPDAYWSQVVVWSDTADDGEDPIFVTRVNPTADGTNIGTWTPSTGSDDFAVVAGPYDAATYTEEASPSASDRCEVVSSTIATGLAITPTSVAGVTVHTYSEGQAITARAIVGDGGGSETAGTTAAISASNTSYTMATATVAPSDGLPWEGSDSIDLVYEVVTV